MFRPTTAYMEEARRGWRPIQREVGYSGQCQRDDPTEPDIIVPCVLPLRIRAWIGLDWTMPDRRFPPPWTVEEYRGLSYIVRDRQQVRRGVCLL